MMHLDHPMTHDDPGIAERVAKREDKTKRSLIAFAVAAIILIPIWLAFLFYV